MYTIFGFFSILVEILVRNQLIILDFNTTFSTVIAVILGIFFAFYANVNYNFKITKSRRNRALIYFIIISILSGLFQLTLGKTLKFENFSYETTRLIISGGVFIFAYLLHRKYSFKDYKKIGVAIYANSVENLEKIHKKVGYYPDFIHVDLVDTSMRKEVEDVKLYKLEMMKAYWPRTQIQTHIMSMKPEEWIDGVINYSDVIFIHDESDSDKRKLISKINSNGKKAGLALMMKTKINDVIELLKEVEYVLLLTISEPGKSGQKFNLNALNKIRELNALSFRNNFTLCIDGGINESIINLIHAENVVSGSSVLDSYNPKEKIMKLQTSNRY